MPPKLKKPTIHRSPDPIRDDGFRSQEDREWFDAQFAERKVLVERVLNTSAEPTPFFIQKFRECGWIELCTRAKQVNASIIRECVASLVHHRDQPYSYHAYVRDIPFILGPRLLSEQLRIQLVDDYFFPYEPGRDGPSYSEIVTELSGGQVTEWDGDKRLRKSILVDKYYMLFLASCNCLFFTKHTYDLDLWRARLLYGIGTRKRICLV